MKHDLPRIRLASDAAAEITGRQSRSHARSLHCLVHSGSRSNYLANKCALRGRGTGRVT